MPLGCGVEADVLHKFPWNFIQRETVAVDPIDTVSHSTLAQKRMSKEQLSVPKFAEVPQYPVKRSSIEGRQPLETSR